jgi:hypothetical protein
MAFGANIQIKFIYKKNFDPDKTDEIYHYSLQEHP